MSRWKQHLLPAPGVVIAILPKFACPACAAAALGVLSSFGIGYVLTATYLLPISALLLAISLVALGYRAGSRRGYGPLAVGAVAAGIVLFGKFKWESALAVYAGVALLVVSSLWNAWPRNEPTSCSQCDADVTT